MASTLDELRANIEVATAQGYRQRMLARGRSRGMIWRDGVRRADAASRRVICLSAILPDGEPLEDFTVWLTGDKADGLIKNDWRPPPLRFGEVDSKAADQYAQLNIIVGEETGPGP